MVLITCVGKLHTLIKLKIMRTLENNKVILLT